jgi:SAM-dependent methyltransferase
MKSSRLKKERNFFDNRYTMRAKAHRRPAPSNLSLFYSRSESKRFYIECLRELEVSKNVLEYGCGTGGSAFVMAELGATACGIDVSEVAIRQARLMADKMRLNNLSFHVMDAEALAFDDDFFDLICGNGVLHHLNLDKAFSEIARVLKPTGRAIFKEPLGYNPLINLYRALTPALHTIDEHPLKKDDFEKAGRYFDKVEVHYFDLFALAAIPLMNFPGSTGLLKIASKADSKVFHLIPHLRRWAGIVVLVLSEPYQSRVKD